MFGEKAWIKTFENSNANVSFTDLHVYFNVLHWKGQVSKDLNSFSVSNVINKSLIIKQLGLKVKILYQHAPCFRWK